MVNKMQERIYGKFKPISIDVRKIINDLYKKHGDVEKIERETAFKVSENQEIINQDLLFAGATSINDAYMLRNTHRVELKNGTTINSLKLRDFKDDKLEEELQVMLVYKKLDVEILAKNFKEEDCDKRKNFTLDSNCLYRIKSGKHKGMCFTIGQKTEKDGSKKNSLFLDIANTPFDKLTSGWQESNFDPFEFAYKLVKDYPNLSEDEQSAVVHVYWLSSNQWAIDYNDPMAVPYRELDRYEQVKDEDHIVVANIYNSETNGIENLNQEKCKDIVRIAKEMLESRLKEEPKITSEKVL